MAMLAHQRVTGPHDASQGGLLQMLLETNTHRVMRSAPTDSRRLSSKRAGNKINLKRHRSDPRGDNTAMGFDEEADKTRQFWEKFAREASKELLNDLEQNPNEIPQEQLLYSGRVGIEAKYPPNIPDDETIITEISLLTCSDVGLTHNRIQRRRRRRRKTLEPGSEKKTNWVEAARGSYGGVLGRMLERDAGALHGLAGGNQAFGMYKNKSELFSQEEQSLLMKCGHTKGISSKDKSLSTENIVTCGDIKKRPQPRQLNKQLSTISTGNANSVSKATDRAPSPRLIARTLTQTKRSESFPSRIDEPSQMTSQRKVLTSSHASSIYGHVAVESIVHEPTIDEDPNSEHSKHIHAQIHTTVSALDRISGYGDQTYELKSIPEEKGLFTDKDYGSIPRYPQNIRVAPQLVQVITSAIKRRASQPRQYELKRQDLYKFDRIQPTLDQASRNLFIFNWLTDMDEHEFIDASQPEISLSKTDRDRLVPIDRVGVDHVVTKQKQSSLNDRNSNVASYHGVNGVDDGACDYGGENGRDDMSDDVSKDSGDRSDDERSSSDAIGDVDSNGPAVGSLLNFSL